MERCSGISTLTSCFNAVCIGVSLFGVIGTISPVFADQVIPNRSELTSESAIMSEVKKQSSETEERSFLGEILILSEAISIVYAIGWKIGKINKNRTLRIK